MKPQTTSPMADNPAPAHQSKGQLVRLKEMQRKPVRFLLNGQAVQALEGDTVLTAVLTQSHMLRTNEFSQLPRAGFCVMGACQDCWVRLDDGRALRSCQNLIEEGMHICTQSKEAA